MRRIEVEVAPEYAGERLDKYLASVVAELSRAQIQRLIRDTRVRVGGATPRANTTVRPGPDAFLRGSHG